MAMDLRPALLLLVLLLGSCNCVPLFKIFSNKYLDELPGHVAAQGRQPNAQHLDISLVDAVFQGPANPDGSLLVNFTAKAYRNNRKVRTRPFAPTVRVRRGEGFSIRLTNDLVAGPGEDLRANKHNHLTLPSFTNLHTHGLWGDPGVRSQPNASQASSYQGHDNIFVVLAPRPNASVPHGDSQTFQYSIPHSHMPGIAWFHPHYHGSSGVQTATAKGVIVVEGEEDFLPAGPKGGCDALRRVLLGGGKQAPPREYIMQVEGFFFGGTRTPTSQPGKLKVPPGLGAPGELRPDFDSYPDISKRSDPANPTCCSEDQGFSSAGFDFLTVNGGYRPVVCMEVGVWQRWRMVYAAYMRYLDLTWTTPEGEPAPCELQLLAKDGVFLQQVPRAVNHVLLPPGGRADLLVRCSSQAGRQLLVRSGFGPMSGVPSTCNQPTCKVMQQEVVLAIQLKNESKDAAAGSSKGELPAEGCRPLRPPHLADLRDEALDAAKVDKGALVKGSIMFFPATMGDMAGVCTVNGDLFAWPDSRPLLAPLGSIVEWALMQTSIHPHHLHTVPMQIVALPDILRAGNTRAGTSRNTTASPPSGGSGTRGGRRLLEGSGSSGSGGGSNGHSRSSSSGGGGGSRGDEGQGGQQRAVNSGDLEGVGLRLAGRRLQQTSGGRGGHFEMMQRMGVRQAEAGMTKANEDAWAQLSTYFKAGDHHDTLLLPLSVPMGGAALVRFQPGHFTGYSVHHCHYLQHEDQGCMKVVKWQCPGHEGNEQPEACAFEYPMKGTLPFGPDGKPPRL